MSPNLSSDFANILSIGIVFTMLNEFLSDKQRHEIGSNIISALSKNRSAPKQYYLRILAKLFREIFTSTNRKFAVCTIAWMIFNIFLSLLLYCFNSNFRISMAAIFSDFDYKFDWYISFIVSLMSLILFASLFRHVLPMFKAKFSLGRAFAIVTSVFALALVSLGTTRLFVHAPIMFLSGFWAPPAVPLEIRVHPAETGFISQSSDGEPRLNMRNILTYERKLTEAERLIVPRLRVSAGGMGRNENGVTRAELYEGWEGSSDANTDDLVYVRITREIDQNAACGKSLLEIAANGLGLGDGSIILTGDDIRTFDCNNRAETVVFNANLVFPRDSFDHFIGLSYGFATRAYTAYTYEIRASRGVEFRTGFYVDKVLTQERSKIDNIEKFRTLRNLLDVRKIETPIRVKIVAAQLAIDAANAAFPLLLLAVPSLGIFILYLFARIRPLNGDERICQHLLVRPLQVFALLFFLVGGTLSLILALTKAL